MPRCPVPRCPAPVRRGLTVAGLAAGLAVPGGLLAHASVVPVAVEAMADGCGVVLLADEPREVLLAVVQVPQEVVLAPVPVEPDVSPSPSVVAEVDPEPTVSPDPAVLPEPTAEPSPSPEPAPDDQDDPAAVAVGTEPLPVPLVPADGAGPDDAYRVVLTDATTLEPLLEVELGLPLCAAPAPVPPASPGPTPTGTPSPGPPDQAAATPPLPDPTAPPDAAPSDPTPATAAPGTTSARTPTRTAAPRSVGVRSFGRLSALRGATRTAPPPVALAPVLPELAPEPSPVPAPVVAYPPGTTGVVLPAPPDRPLGVLRPMVPGTGSQPSTPPAQVLLTGAAPREGIGDALPPALLVAAAAAGFLATQLRRRVPLRIPR